jgi:hypothetical protein
MPSSTGKGGKRKIGRCVKSPSHKRYIMMDKHTTNKIRRIKKFFKKNPNDKTAKAAKMNI